jgi:hypothetical protein
MKVLYISDNFPDSPSGGNFANRAFVNAFSELADKCLLLYSDKEAFSFEKEVLEKET